MDFALSYEQQAIRDLVRDFGIKEITPVAAHYDEQEEFPLPIIQKLGELGILGLPLPEAYGGGGADTISYCIAIEELARADSSVAITVAASTSLAGLLLVYFGSDQQQREFLAPLARGEALGAFALTETGAGSDSGNLETTARFEDGQWVINGTKSFVTNGGTPLTRFALVAGVTGARPDGRKEISTFIVPHGTPGFSQASPYRKIGWHASDTRELSFADCRVPAANLLGEQGAGHRQFLQVLDSGRVGIAAMAVGLAQGCLDMSLLYAQERRQFGRPIASFQAIQFKLADIATQVETSRLLTYQAAWLRDQGRPFRREAAIAKLFASEAAVRVADQAVQIHGGYGYIEESAVARFYRDAKILTIGEGTSEIQRLVIARELGCPTDGSMQQ